MVIITDVDDQGRKWLKIMGMGEKFINALTVIGYIICVLWIIGVLPF